MCCGLVGVGLCLKIIGARSSARALASGDQRVFYAILARPERIGWEPKIGLEQASRVIPLVKENQALF